MSWHTAPLMDEDRAIFQDVTERLARHPSIWHFLDADSAICENQMQDRDDAKLMTMRMIEQQKHGERLGEWLER